MYNWQNVFSALQTLFSFSCFLAIQMLFNFMKCHFLIVFFNCWTNEDIFRKSLAIHISLRALLKFSLSIFRILGLTLRSWIYLKLVFVQSKKYGSNFILLPMDILFSQYHLLKMLVYFFNSGWIFIFFANLQTMSGSHTSLGTNSHSTIKWYGNCQREKQSTFLSMWSIWTTIITSMLKYYQ